ncbi:Cof-type HAD-IIB family hydrolase [Peribacillus huizhouensis]|uniref:Hydrolase Cof n=1 Tax=Peribacillus huizhouensis TaxID=1501239 RepID=A0ABR6CJ82_9BACI|nr:Cof-type HAD-IIB family hydrolase [Peribacillus huizhouensis]MBA9025038.1 hypothetical protein [Peribacillus huizhouensis]
MQKIVFFDIDGTLLDHEKTLPASTKAAIKQLQENGVYVAIATGRAPFMFESLREELDIESFVSFNGQYVVFENEVIYKNPLSFNELERLHEMARENEETSLVFMNEKTMKASVIHSDRIEEALGTLKFPHPERQDDFYHDKEIYQTLYFCTAEEEEALITGKFDKFKFIRWHDLSIDVLPFGGSKAEGIKQFVKKAGFDMENVYAFGDGLNDIEMLETVGHGVAMGNAVDEVKKHADFVTKDVSEEGILYGLRQVGLI